MGNSKDISVENSDARQKGRKRIEFRAKSVEELWALAEISKEKGEIFDAIAIYEVMLEKSPQNPAILLQLANTCVIVGHLDRARQLCARLNYSQMPVDMLEILLQLYAWELSDRDGAIQVAKRILELDPSSEIVQQVARGNIPEKPKAAILNSEGIVLYWNGHSTQAEYKFREALSLNPKLREALVNLSTVLRYTGREEGLKEIYETLLHINSKDLTAIYELAHYFDNAGNFEEAEKYYGKSLEIDPEYFPALINIAQLLCDRERFAESEVFFHRAVKVDPSDPEVWFKFGFCLMEKGNYSEGYKAYSRAHQLQPEYFGYSKALNLAEKQLRGEIDWATISKIMKKPLEPPNGIVRISSMYDKKVIQVEGKDIGPFFDILEDISLISPLNVYILPNANVLRVPQPEIQKVIDSIAAGINEVKSMNLQKAETVFREIFAQYPDIKGTRHNLVVNLMQQGKLDEAHEILRPLADNNNLNVTEKILLGHLMHEKGLHNTAEKIYADALLNAHTIDKYGAINLNFYYNEQEKY